MLYLKPSFTLPTSSGVTHERWAEIFGERRKCHRSTSFPTRAKMDCQNCKAPLAENCPCEACQGAGLQTYCHVCRGLYRTIYTSTYFSSLSKSEEAAALARWNRMGL